MLLNVSKPMGKISNNPQRRQLTGENGINDEFSTKDNNFLKLVSRHRFILWVLAAHIGAEG